MHARAVVESNKGGGGGGFRVTNGGNSTHLFAEKRKRSCDVEEVSKWEL